MNAPHDAGQWLDANQQLLVAQFGRLKARLRSADDSACRREVEALRQAMPAPAALDTLVETFALSPFEGDIVLLAAGAEMDSEFSMLCGSASGQGARPWASFGLALAALDGAHWSALAPGGPLRRWHLIDVDEGGLLTSSRLRLDETVLHFLAGVGDIDVRLAPLLRPLPAPDRLAASQQALAEQIAAALGAGAAPTVLLHGDDPGGREDVATAAAAASRWRLVAIDPQAIPAAPPDLALLATLWQRQALLGNTALFIECGDEPLSAAVRAFIERVHGAPVFVGADDAVAGLRQPARQHRVALPPAADQFALWQAALGQKADAHPDELMAVVAQFRFGARRIAALGAALCAGPGAANGDASSAASAAANAAKNGAGLHHEPLLHEPLHHQPVPWPAGALWKICRDAVPARLSALAQPVQPSAGWDDLVLPDAQKEVLRQVIVHMQRRFEVHERWGFGAKLGRGLGVTVLFAGDSGTGKTLAAEVLAATLRLTLYRIDLSAVVSKYIGETEKNLRRVFDAAEDSGSILLFDEADALFGKRSDVRDSHDRYANIEVSYLLQRMENYRGLAILTTNHKSALDTAFMRRLRFVVHFPFPEAVEREAIWRRAFPAATPTDALAWDKLARLQVAGGHIQNIALAAAFNAADASEPVSMLHVLRAARADAAKRERAMADAETRGWT